MGGSVVDGKVPGMFVATNEAVILNTNPRYASLPFSGFGLTAELKKRAQV
jgi:hypothetical protein